MDGNDLAVAARDRFAGLLPADSRHARIDLVGCGGIGSWLGVTLAKLGFTRVSLYDFDAVEAVNIGPQAFLPQQISIPKAAALADLMMANGGIAPTWRQRRWDAVDLHTSQPDVLILAPDNMETRQEARRAAYARPMWVVDARMGGETVDVRTYSGDNPESMRVYDASLFDDAEGVEEPCTTRATTYAGMLAAALAASMVKTIAIGGQPPRAVTIDVPSMDTIVG